MDQGSVIHHLTADGISAYVAQLRTLDIWPDRESNLVKAKSEDPEDGKSSATAPDEESKSTSARGDPKSSVLTWETEMWRRVKMRREELGLSIQDVYETDSDYSYVIEGYENGAPCEWDPITELSLNDDERNSFADLLQCSLDYLYSRSDIPETAEQLLNNLPTEKIPIDVSEAAPEWQTGEPPRAGRYLCMLDLGLNKPAEQRCDYKDGAWIAYGRPVADVGKVVGWWPLPER